MTTKSETPVDAFTALATAPVRERAQDVQEGKDQLTPLKQRLAAGYAAFHRVESHRTLFEKCRGLLSMTPPGPHQDAPLTRLRKKDVSQEFLNEVYQRAEAGLSSLRCVNNLHQAQRRVNDFGGPRQDLEFELREIDWLISAVASAPADAEEAAVRLEAMLAERKDVLDAAKAAGIPHRLVGVLRGPDPDDVPVQTRALMDFDPFGRP